MGFWVSNPGADSLRLGAAGRRSLTSRGLEVVGEDSAIVFLAPICRQLEPKTEEGGAEAAQLKLNKALCVLGNLA